MKTRMLAATAVVIMTGMLGACGVSYDRPPVGVPTPTATMTSGEAPEHFVVRYGETELQLAPFAWSIGEQSGTHDEEPPSIGSPEEIFVFVPIDGWGQLGASQYSGESMYSCDGVTVGAQITDLGRGWYSLRPQGPAGEYTLEIDAGSWPGTGPGSPNGTMTAALRWTVATDTDYAEMEAASAYMSLVAETDGVLEAGDLMPEVINLFPPTVDVDATVTVSARGAESLTFDLVS